MYEIWIKNGDNEELLHALGDHQERKVLAGGFTDPIGTFCCPTAHFTLTHHHPAYDRLHELTTLVTFKNTLTGETEFEGRILRKPKDGMSGDGKITRQYTCEGLINYLRDSVQLYRTYRGISVPMLLESLLAVHNQRCPDKTIRLGQCDIAKSLTAVTMYRSTLEELRANLTDKFGGEMRLRRAGGELVLDYLAGGVGEKKSTVIEVGRNLVSIEHSTDAGSIITRLIPLGKQLDDGSPERLTLRGYYADDPERCWVEDADAAAQFTDMEGTVTFDEIETQEELAQEAERYLAENNRIKRTYRAEVLDLSAIGAERGSISSGNTYRFHCEPAGLDEELRIISRTVDAIEKPYRPTVEIGDKMTRLSETQANLSRTIQFTLPQQRYDILDAAKAIATELIHNATTGFLVIRPDELLIMDTPDVETASNVWRFNSSGLGYSSTGYTGTYGLAITMDGAIVADFITTGILRSLQIINGENGQFSVDTNGNCIANALTSNNAVITGGSVAVSGQKGTVRVYDGMIAFDNAAGNRTLEIYGDGKFRTWSETYGNWLSLSFVDIAVILNDHSDRINRLEARVSLLEDKTLN